MTFTLRLDIPVGINLKSNMKIDSTGPVIGHEEISDLESMIGAVLDDGYREFLLRCNGGSPTPDTIDIPEAPGTPTDVQVLFGIGRSTESSDLLWNTSIIGERGLKEKLLPIGCDSGGNLFCLQIVGGRTGKVLYYDLESPGNQLYSVAPNFQTFVQKLRPFGH